MTKINRDKILIRNAVWRALSPDFKVETRYKSKSKFGSYYDVKILSPNEKYKAWFRATEELIDGVDLNISYDYIGKLVKQAFGKLAMEIYY